MTRYLRIAAAVCFALLAISLICVWIRSYSLHDQLTYEWDRSIWFGGSTRGEVTIGREAVQMRRGIGDRFQLLTLEYDRINFARRMPTTFGFGYLAGKPGGASLTLPHWFLAVCSFVLAALWARSHRYVDIHILAIGDAHCVIFNSYAGRILLGVGPTAPYDQSRIGPSGWWRESRPVEARWKRWPDRSFSFGFDDEGRYFEVRAPHWLYAGAFATIAALFAFKRLWRFSVRSILIATTLLAIALGIGVWFVQ